MTEGDIDVTFTPPRGDRTTLPKAALATLDALFRHPIAHNLEWSDVVALLTRLGTVRQASHNEMTCEIGGAHHQIRKPHGKDLSADEVMMFRHLLTRSGWSPLAHDAAGSVSGGASAATGADLLVVITHHEARLYHLDALAAEDVLRPYDPHHFLHHLSHKDQSRERGQRAPEDPSFYRRIAEAMTSAGQVVVIGHGEGHSNAAHHLMGFLKLHHPDIFQKVTCERVADLSSLTPPQLLALARRALTQSADPHPAT